MKVRSSTSIVVLFLMLGSLLASGCDSRKGRPSAQPRQAPSAQQASAAEPRGETSVGDADEEEEEAGPPAYSFSPIGKRDPFRSPFLDVTGPGRRMDETEALTALQRWDVEQLAVRGIISATADPVAMVVDPEGHGYMVRPGTLIGRNWGRVTAVRRECIVVTEQRRDPTGMAVAVQQERCLPDDDRDERFDRQMRGQLQ